MKKDMSYLTFITALEDMTMSNAYDDILNTIIGYMRDASELASVKALTEHNTVYSDYAGVLTKLANKTHDILKKHGVYDELD